MESVSSIFPKFLIHSQTSHVHTQSEGSIIGEAQYVVIAYQQYRIRRCNNKNQFASQKKHIKIQR